MSGERRAQIHLVYVSTRLPIYQFQQNLSVREKKEYLESTLESVLVQTSHSLEQQEGEKVFISAVLASR